jgi:GH25 family lysozyme M1 (1,4-beta-N-acetylmuramidase)
VGSRVLALAALVLLCSAATYPKGVDVSNHQGPSIDWLQVAGAGYTFAFAKASEGTTFTDSTYAINRTGTNAAGLYFGAYHFAQPAGTSDATITASAIAQADHFVNVAQPRGGDLPPVLDLETANGLKQPALVKWTQAWLDEVAARTGASAMVYTSPSFWRTYLGDTNSVATGGRHLWVAHWTTTSAPLVPASNWGGLGWSFWQWSDCLSVPGVPTKCVDGDRVNAADAGGFTLAALLSGAPASATPPTIVGTVRAGAKLAAVPGTWNGGKPVAFTYQWQSCDGAGANCAPISGATLETYTPSSNEVGHTIVVAVTATTKALAAAASSAPTTPVAAASGATVPAVVASPQLSGTAVAGSTLTATTGTWSGSPTEYAFQWQRCDASAGACAPITSATAATYVLTPGDIGTTIEVFVTATNGVGSQAATSSPTGVILAAPVPTPTPDAATAQLGQAGAVVTADGSATVTWQPGAVPAGSAVGLAITGARLALTLSPQLVTLPWPVDVAYTTPPDTQIVGFSTNGRIWSAVAPLTSSALPAGVLAGVFQGHVVTRRPGFYELFTPNAWGDPRKVSRFAPRLRRVAAVKVKTLRSGARVVSTRMSTPSQIYFQPGRRHILAPGAFPVRIRVRKGTHVVHLVAVDPWGRRGGFTLSFR